MGTGVTRGRWLLLGLVLFVGALGWWVVGVTLMRPGDRVNASGYGQFVIAVAGLLLAVWPYVHPHLRGLGAVSVDELADRLAAAVEAQWSAAARDRGLRPSAPLPIRWRRCAVGVAGPTGAATTRRFPGESFRPLPGMNPITPGQLREGTYRMLHRIYGGLASGRLILAGGPGSGKSSAAILLLLETLRHRKNTPSEHRDQVPVPVLFTLAGWDPDTTAVHEWLATKLTELPPLRGHRGRVHATRLMTAGRIAVFLDGLDEISEPHRPTILRALAQQATFRLVLLTRTTELTRAAQQHILTGAAALELQRLTPTDAATYLRHNLLDPPPPPWHRLLTTLATQPTAPLTTALNNPLTITLLREIYYPVSTDNITAGHVDELLDTTRFPTPDHISHHLLDHAITSAYTPRPGEPRPRYTPRTAHHTLTVIAQHLREHHTRDLAWWRINSWAPRTPRAFLAALAATITISAFVLVFGLSDELLLGFLVVGLSMPLSRLLGRFARGQPRRLSRFRWRRVLWRSILGLMLVCGLAGGLMFGFLGGALGVAVGGFGRTLLLGFLIGFVAGLVFCLLLGFGFGLLLVLELGLDSGDLSKVGAPYDLWRTDLAAGLVFGPVTALGFGLAGGLMFELVGLIGLSELLSLLVFCFVIGLLAGLLSTAAWRAAISQIYFTARYHTPLRLGRFLVDAHHRHLLRAVGPIYQFRHATLQDRLAPPHAPSEHAITPEYLSQE
jgi:hypothetical protein